MATTTLIDKKQWKAFLDRTVDVLEGSRVSVEVLGDEIGDQQEDLHAPLTGLNYDPARDVLWIHTERVEHQISSPQELGVLGEGTLIEAIEIETADLKYVLRFDRPRALPR